MCCAAALAGAQMHPLSAGLDAFLAHVLPRVLQGLHAADMSAAYVHGSSSYRGPDTAGRDHDRRSSSLRFQFARVAAASYVLCRNSSSTFRGDAAVRTSSYPRKNSPNSG